MTNQELISLIESGDLAAARDYLNAAAANQPTPYLNLNQWQRSDKPVMDDFNDDNRKIDEGFRVLSEAKADKTELAQGLAGKANKAVPGKQKIALNAEFAEYNNGRCYYQKSDNGLVCLSFEIVRADRGVMTNHLTIPFKLPKAVQPAEVVRFACIYFATEQAGGSTSVPSGSTIAYITPPAWLAEAGECRVIIPASATPKVLMGSTCYFAAE